MAPEKSHREYILERLIARLEAIKTDDDEFSTDAGRNIYLGETQLGEHDPPEAIAIVPNDDEQKYQGQGLFLTWPITIYALGKIDGDDTVDGWRRAERVLADVKRAIELEDRTLDGAVKPWFERDRTRSVKRFGSLTVGIAITYLFSYTENWGNP